jgi:hypothetical protein
VRPLNFNILPLQSTTVLSISSNAIDANQLFRCSAQVIMTSASTITGTVTLQGSNDQGPLMQPSTAPINWTNIPSASISVTGPGSFLVPNTEICYQWVRAQWSPSTGLGTINVNLKALGT